MEVFADATDDTSRAIEWTMPDGRYVDAAPILILTTASLRTAADYYPNGTWDVRRFRPNVLIDLEGDGWIEDSWAGARSSLEQSHSSPPSPVSAAPWSPGSSPGSPPTSKCFAPWLDTTAVSSVCGPRLSFRGACPPVIEQPTPSNALPE